MAIKVDMSKAYNRMEWIFLKVVLSQMGFHLQWINLIMTCVTYVFYSLLINGKPQPVFKPTRGIQGDPLSPYLFIICAEFMNSSLPYCFCGEHF